VERERFSERAKVELRVLANASSFLASNSIWRRSKRGLLHFWNASAKPIEVVFSKTFVRRNKSRGMLHEMDLRGHCAGDECFLSGGSFGSGRAGACFDVTNEGAGDALQAVACLAGAAPICRHTVAADRYAGNRDANGCRASAAAATTRRAFNINDGAFAWVFVDCNMSPCFWLCA
jgi:hypothetical protein